MKNLTKYDVALIGVRLLAIYVVLQFINNIPTWTLAISMLFDRTFLSNTSYPFMFKSFAICLPLLAVLIPITLWLLSNKIAQFIIKPSKNMMDNSDIATTNTKDLQTILFCAIGLFIFVITASELITWIYGFIFAYIKTPQLVFPQSSYISKFIELLLKTVFSLILIFSAENLSRLLYKLRHGGSQ
jgi:hypothetical protein